MKTIGKKTEQAYKEFFLCKCPRKRKGVFKECLMTDWHQLINELSDLPIQINQFIKGKKGDRKFFQEITEERIDDMETKVKKYLIRTKEGVAFYREGKEKAIKNLTFCVLGCQMLKKEHGKPKSNNLSKIKALLINMLLIYYYLVGEKSISNATIQEFEERITQRLNKGKESLPVQLKETVDEPKIIGTKESTESDFILDQLPKIEIALDLPELRKSRKPSFLTTKDNDERELIKTIEIQESKQDMIVIDFDLQNRTQEQIDSFYKLIITCDNCESSNKECKEKKQEIRRILKEEGNAITVLWNSNPSIQSCIAKVITEQIERGE